MDGSMAPLSGKKARDACVEQARTVEEQDLNIFRHFFGGQAMTWMDIAAGTVALNYTGMNVTTVAVDDMLFFAPAYLGDRLLVRGKVVNTGRTSMEVLVEVEKIGEGDSRALIQKAHFVLVALDAEFKPAPVPPLIIETDEEQKLWDAAEKRKALRKQRRDMGV
jgi:acyl-CoA hydrolase